MNCGTRSGYQLHLRLKTPPCIDCKAANAQRRREYYASNPKKVYEINRRWASSNPDKIKGYSRRMASKRKALKKSNGHIPYTDEEVFETHGRDCHICLEPIDFNAPRQAYTADGWELGLQFDHLIPLSKGGSDTLDNIRPSHALCNMKKRNN
jgi:5-methylcytosine-specific restriction endonuclease McrA